MSPTNEHEELKARAFTWLSSRATGRGMRAAPEVRLGEKYVADGVAIANLQKRYKDSFLPEWNESKVTSEPRPNPPIPPYSFLFECKRDMKDYLSTFGEGLDTTHANARMDPVANFHFVVVSKEVDNVLNENDRPQGWGWLVEKGPGLSLEWRPSWNGHGYVDWDTLTWRVLWGMESTSMKNLVRTLRKIDRDMHREKNKERDE